MLKFSCFLICFVGYTTAAYVDTLKKCSIKDEECLRNLYQSIVKDLGSNGVSELGIAPVDPYVLEDITVTVLGLLNITMVKGTATGISGCIFKIFTFDPVKKSGTQENVCNITIEGKVNIESNSLLKSLLTDIHGDGNGIVTMNDLHLTFDYPAYIQKRDGELYIKVDYKNIKYDYEVEGRTVFAVDSIYLGNQETSKTILPFINENDKFVMKTFGRAFIDKAVSIYFHFASKFFDVVPCKHYIIEDLSPYAEP